MSLRVTQVLLGLSLLLNAFVLAGYVFHSWFEPPHRSFAGGRPPPPGQPGQGNRWPNPLETLAQDLKLNDEQMKAVRPIIDEYGNTRRDRWRDIGKIREEMSAELQKPSFDWPTVDALVDRMTVLRAEQQKQNLRAVEQMAARLKPEQQAELHKILGERYGGQGWRREGGSAGPRQPRSPQ
jgi:Spy/CpxP family protein refolding chaperone